MRSVCYAHICWCIHVDLYLITSDKTEFEEEEREAKIELTTTLASVGWTESDSRPSTIVTGTVVGLLCCVIPIVAIIVLDLPALHRDLCRMIYNVTGKEKYNSNKKVQKSHKKGTREVRQADKPNQERGRGRWTAEFEENEV